MAEKELVYRLSFEGLDAQAAAIGKVDTELSDLNKTIKEQRQTLEILTASNQKGTVVYEEVRQAVGKNIVQQRTLTKTKGDLIRETQNEAKVNQLAEGSIEQLRAKLSLATKEYNSLSKAERENANIGGKIQSQTRALSDELKSLESAVGDNRRNVGNYGSALQDLAGQINIAGVNVGGLANKFTGLRDSVTQITSGLKGNIAATKAQATATNATTAATSGASKGLKLFRLALISTGIGAIVVGIGALVGAFLSTQKGIDAVTRVLNPLKVAFESVVGFLQNTAIKVFTQPKEALKDLGDFIVGQFTNRINALKNIFSGVGDAFDAVTNLDFSGAFDALSDVGSNFIDLGTGVKNTSKSITEFTKQAIETGNQISDLEIKIRDLTRTNTSLIAGYNEEIETLKAIAADTSKTAKEREVAGKQAIELIEERRLAQLNLIDAEIQLLELRQSLSDTDAEGLQQLEDLKAKRNQVNKEAVAGGKEVTGQINAAIQSEANAAKAALKAQVDANKAALEQLEELRNGNSLASIKNEAERTAAELKLQRDANLKSVEALKVSEAIKKQIRDEFNDQYKIAIDQLNAEIAAKEADAQFQLNQVKLDGEKQFITDKVALGEFELAQLTQKQERELQIFEGTETEKKVLLQEQLNARNALIQKNDAFLLQQKFDNEQARIETDILLAESQAERDALAFDLLVSKQTEELALFEGTEEQRTLLLAQQKQARDALLEQEVNARIASNFAIADSYANLFTSLAGLFEKNAALQKAAALFQIGIDTAKAISAVTAAAASTSITPIDLAIKIAAGIATVITNIAKAKKLLSDKPKFEDGGIVERFATGGELPQGGGFIKGRSHKEGGVRFAVGGQVMEAEGGEIIVNKNIQSRPDFVQQISRMNALTGGKDFYSNTSGKFAVGGIIAPKFNPQGANITSSPQGATVSEVATLLSSTLNNIQVVNNVTDTSSNQSMLIQIQNQTTI